MDYMQESRATAAYHVNAIAAQQVALQHVALPVASRVNVPLKVVTVQYGIKLAQHPLWTALSFRYI